MQSIATGDRPKDSVRKKTKTETQFKREFLKSEDVARQKDNLERLPRARRGTARGTGRARERGLRLSLLLWTFISLTFMNYFQLFLSPANSNGSFKRVLFSPNRNVWNVELNHPFVLIFSHDLSRWRAREYLGDTYLNNFDTEHKLSVEK